MKQSGYRRKRSVNYWVYALGSSLAKGATRFYVARFGVHVPEMRILSNLGSFGVLASRDIVTLTAMDKALVSRVLSGLARRGFVEGLASKPDSRLRRWRLTPSGREMVARLRPMWKKREALIQAVLTDAEREQLLDMLERLFHSSERLRAEEARALTAERKRAGAGAQRHPNDEEGSLCTPPHES